MILEHEFYPPEFKYSSKKPIINLPIPKRVVMLMQQHTGAQAQPTVKAGDTVIKGQVIGDSPSYIFAPIHSSISGIVKSISPWFHPMLGREMASITIEANGNTDEILLSPLNYPITPDEVRLRAREAGLVGQGGAAFPTHVKLNPTKPIEYAIINGAECEPFLTVDHRQMLENPEKLISGLKLIMLAVGAKKGLIAIEDNKKDAINLLIEMVRQTSDIRVFVLPSKYPQGAEKVMIKTIIGKEVPRGGLPLDVGVVVSNVSTAISLTEAVFEGKVFTEKVITISGDAVNEAINVKVHLGVMVKDVINNLVEFSDSYSRLIMGGPMTGFSQATLEVPIIKGTSGLLFLKKTRFQEAADCIRCGRCVLNCPLRLMPAYIASNTKLGDYSMAEFYGASDCFECGKCSYVCPANIPLVHYVKVAKTELFKIKMTSSKS
ncbi:MAG: Electron transport complex subunit RnfC [candidate division WS2 bacterium]|uniref:Ion-translocating oxidoreductase complex subunit C n=1 Tax=Psychracetigena formicireducens TaxID=2986056 RepID=A0A9E2BG59_PSYF1|nr:Electron transport complex subunit RnfC [Candidatus Psychracetigena formicireducens]MBT9150579.1 Electron transport complex subunit RnfC [Candidatus Psychracetigena formicireducens]